MFNCVNASSSSFLQYLTLGMVLEKENIEVISSSLRKGFVFGDWLRLKNGERFKLDFFVPVMQSFQNSIPSKRIEPIFEKI